MHRLINCMQQDFCVLMHWKLLLPPATKFAKVIFLHLSVSHSVHRGGSASRVSASTWVCIGGGGLYLGFCIQGVCSGGGLPRGVCIQAGFASNWGCLYLACLHPRGLGKLPPPPSDTTRYGQRAGGTRPTGMDPCY